jgi:predicted kinase
VPALYLLCGLSFSGKSTVARVLGDLGVRVLSYDAMNRDRGLPFGGEGLPVEAWERTAAQARDRFRALAVDGADVAVDDTNCFRWLRDRWRALAQELGYQVLVLHLPVPLEEIERRRAAAADRPPIGDDVFITHAATFEPPAANEPALAMDPAEGAAAFAVRALTAGGRFPSPAR